MPANSGNPRGAHPTGAARSPIGTSGCQELVKLIKCTQHRCESSSVGKAPREAGNKGTQLSSAPSSGSKAWIWPGLAWESCS